MVIFETFTKQIYRNLFNFRSILFVVVITGIYGCAGGGSFGRLQWSNSTTYTFESYEIVSNHQYYVSGGKYKPWAIIAVHNDYTLRSNYWKKADNVTTEQLRMWVRNMKLDWCATYLYNGAHVVGPNQEKIGLWYSFQPQTTVKLLADNTVMIYTPNVTGPNSILNSRCFDQDK